MEAILPLISVDEISINSEFEKYKNAVCCSYVGRKSKLREVARRDIMSRIVNIQIKFGVLIFGRGTSIMILVQKHGFVN